MKKWTDYKKNIDSISSDEIEQQNLLSDLVCSIIRRREELGLSQRDLAKKSGVKQPAIARLENQGATPRIDTLLKILTALDLKVVLTPDEEAVTSAIA